MCAFHFLFPMLDAPAVFLFDSVLHFTSSWSMAGRESPLLLCREAVTRPGWGALIAADDEEGRTSYRVIVAFHERWSWAATLYVVARFLLELLLTTVVARLGCRLCQFDGQQAAQSPKLLSLANIVRWSCVLYLYAINKCSSAYYTLLRITRTAIVKFFVIREDMFMELHWIYLFGNCVKTHFIKNFWRFLKGTWSCSCKSERETGRVSSC